MNGKRVKRNFSLHRDVYKLAVQRAEMRGIKGRGKLRRYFDTLIAEDKTRSQHAEH